jgi:hypothetical protein
MSRLILAALCVVAAIPAQAQQFKVYTRVTRPSFDKQQGADEILSRSLTLFHAGRVYDLIPSVGEVTVFDLPHKRFIVFSARKMIGTKVAFDEVTRMLGTAREETSNWTARLIESRDPKSIRIAEPLKFQLAPKFQDTFNESDKTLTMLSSRFSYIVDCREAESKDLLDAYLNYTDWAARLNYVLYPNTLYPQPRLVLNDKLRKLEQLPSRVQLKVDFDQPLRRQAEHRFSWKLEPIDRQHLNQWQKLIDGGEMEWVSFREYHRRVIVQKNVQVRK